MKSATQLFFKQLSQIIASEHPFVVYRKPKSDKLHYLVQKNTQLHYLESYNQQGFVFAPFDKNSPKIIFPINECEQHNFTIVEDELKEILHAKSEIVAHSTTADERKRYISLVENTINFIKKGKAEKIVLSRKESLKPLRFNPVDALKRMLLNYTNAFVYLWFHPKVGCWMGASPEQFVNMYKNKFKTVALAATQTYKDTLKVKWNEKEKQEQQFVTNYIINTIQPVVNNLKISKPTTVKAGNLVHIKTKISAELQSKEAIKELIELLHPTPAVCGLPKETATWYISDNEGYNRSFYTGFLGELNMWNRTNLFVNLRCMEQTLHTIDLYIGGGITAESNAEKEWEETTFKAEIMKQII